MQRSICALQVPERESTPEEIARYVVEHEEAHKWMDDALTADGMEHLLFDERSIGFLRQARLRVGRDIIYLDSSLPVSDYFPPGPTSSASIATWMKAKDIDARVSPTAPFST